MADILMSEVDYYYILVMAGQSNGMAYGEGIPLPQGIDSPHPRIKQLARRSQICPGGEPCNYNDIIPLDHCPHDVQDMSGYSHPMAKKNQYGTVGQALHIAKKLLPFIPDNAGILTVPCCRGGSAFTAGGYGVFSEQSGATHDAMRWGKNTPLYMDLVNRTRAALEHNPENKFLGVYWMQGEFDIMSDSFCLQPSLFNEMVKAFRYDLAAYRNQFLPESNNIVPWFCGDTTWYWKEQYPQQYDFIYGNYKNYDNENIIFVSFQEDEERGLTNSPGEDPDDLASGYYGSSYRTEENWTTALRSSHFNSVARRGIIPDKFACATFEFYNHTFR